MVRFLSIYNSALEKINSGEPNSEILNFITEECDRIIGENGATSILVIDKHGLLRNASSPRLPKDYLKAIDGIKPDPNVGTCAAAAATGKTIFTPDFCADNKWAELKHLPLAIGYKGAWSVPIKNDQNKVIGTFGTYFTSIRLPEPVEVEGTKLLADVVTRLLN